MGLSAVNTAAGRHTDHDRAGKFACRTIAKARGFRNDLVIGRIDIIGELHFDAGPQAVNGHADCRADDAKLADRRIEAAFLAVFLLQSGGAAEDAAEITDILAEHDHFLIAFHGNVVGVLDRLDHGHFRHRLLPPHFRTDRSRIRNQSSGLVSLRRRFTLFLEMLKTPPPDAGG